jgi:hypothetical protein
LHHHSEAARRGAVTIWTIYDWIDDDEYHPWGFIARQLEVSGGEKVRTGRGLIADLETIRAILSDVGLVKSARQDGDEAHIVESWI